MGRPSKHWNSFIILLCILSLHSSAYAQFRTINPLPSELPESSGLIALDSGLFITHNDGGDGPTLYVIDTTVKVIKEHHLKNARNVDWEDVASAPDGTIFVGDFGNNDNTRTNQTVYIIPAYSKWQGDSSEPEKITFTFADQKAYPPPKANKNFDCEAMVWFNDSLHLFSKNWSSPFNGYSKHYVLPAKPGHYTVFPVDSVNLGGIQLLAFVTAADVAGDKLYLLGTAYVWEIDFQSGRITGPPRLITLGHATQKEGLAFFDNALYITDEPTGGPANLYRYDLDGKLDVKSKKAHGPGVTIRDFGHDVVLSVAQGQVIHSMKLVDMTGRLVAESKPLSNEVQLSEEFSDFSILSTGYYGLILILDNGRMWSTRIYHETP